MAYYIRDGRRNYFIEFGSGHAVVLLHGITNSGRAWGPQIAALVSAGFRVIVPDHAGHGASGRLDRAFGIEEIASDTIALMRHLGLPKADLVGLSLGGMIVLQLALAMPQLVGKIVVANSLDTTATPAFRQLSQDWASTFRSPDGPVMVLEQSWPMMVNSAFQASQEGQRTYQVWHGVAASADGESLAHISEGFIDFDLTAELGRVRKQALFIAGGQDSMSAPEISRRMAEAVPDARYVELPGASHISNVDSAERFNAALLPFLSN